jgi:hypothetical protein
LGGKICFVGVFPPNKTHQLIFDRALHGDR